MTNGVKVNLAKGMHTLGIQYLPENENMNIDTNHALVDNLRIERVR